MTRKKLLNCRIQKILTLIIIFHVSYLSNIALANEETKPLQDDKDFKILYHETLDFHFETIPSNESEVQSKSAQTSAQKKQEDTTMMSFDAFDRHFELILESNAHLIANLPQQQQKNLQKSLQLYRGKLKDNDQSWVRITREGDRVSGMIWDGNEIYIIDNSNEVPQALETDEKSQSSYPLIYRLSDTETDDQRCALDASAHPMNNYQSLVKELSENAIALAQANAQLDIAVVADTQFVTNNSNPDVAVVTRMNVVDGIFSEQVGVHLNLSEIRALQNNGGLTSNNPGTLLNQFGDFSAAPGFNNPGLAHLFTGRDLSGSTIGIAYLNSLCSSRFGIGVSQINGSGIAGALTVAHELGHNFGAPHDNQSGSPCTSTAGTFIMNPSLNGSDQFSQCSLDQIQPAVQNAACITGIDVTPLADVRVTLPENPITININQTFNFIIEVQNTSNAAAENVTANISIADELTIQSSETDGGSCTSTTDEVICDLGDINNNEIKTITITLQANQSGSFINTIEVAADNDDNPGNNQIEAVINVQDVDNTDLFEAHFNSDSEGFVYVDDAFRNTNQPIYALGNFSASLGFNGGGLWVYIGGRSNDDINNMSGGWKRSFSVDNLQTVTLSFRYKLIQSSYYEPDEISEALVSIDGELISQTGADYIVQIQGDGNGGINQDTGWKLVNINMGELASGTHTLTIGAFNNKKTYRNEASLMLIDDVVLQNATPSNNSLSAECPNGANFATNGEDLNFCWFEDLPVPEQANAYCDYLSSHQIIGYYFDMTLNAACPSGIRSGSDGNNLNFCLFENIPVPEGAQAQCDELNSNRRIGYSFPRQ
jgi:uncharacterized repeat protein (TIGR01451 family)